MNLPRRGAPLVLRRGRRVLTGTVTAIHRNGTRMDSGHFALVKTVAGEARIEWWQWKGFTVEAAA